MSTKIEWTDETWNPVTGCTPISEGCANCYAKRMANRLRGRFGYPEDEPFRVVYHTDRFFVPKQWKQPRHIFVCSMGDLFHEDVPTDFIEDVFTQAATESRHTFIFLTKRPAQMMDVYMEMVERDGFYGHRNLWFGVTAENQARADERIPILLQIPAAVRFVSVEPMLGPVNLLWALRPQLHPDLPCLDWVICGAETGPGARYMNPSWARDLRDECLAAGIPFFMKKMSGGKQPPPDLMVREFPGENK